MDIVENNLADLSMGMRKRTGWIYNKDDLTDHSVKECNAGTLKDKANVENRGAHWRNSGLNAPRTFNNARLQVLNDHSQVSTGNYTLFEICSTLNNTN